MENLTAKVSCFARAHHYRNHSAPIFADPAAERLLERGCKFTALFAMADVMAIGAIRALTDHGLKVPEDVSVMGFDGLKIADYMVPKLSTVRQNVDALADESIRILLENIPSLRQPRHETVPVQVELKESIRNI